MTNIAFPPSASILFHISNRDCFVVDLVGLLCSLWTDEQNINVRGDSFDLQESVHLFPLKAKCGAVLKRYV